jgi:hypothetical protein
MLSALQPARTLRASFQGKANALIEQIIRLGNTSPIAQHQQQLVREIQSLAQALKDTVLDEQISTKKFDIVVNEQREQVLCNIIKSAAEHMSQEQVAKKTAFNQAELLIDQTLALKKTTIKETTEEHENAGIKEPPVNIEIKISELMHVLEREAKETIHYFKEEKPSQIVAMKTEQQVSAEKITELPSRVAEEFIVTYEKAVDQHLEKITKEIEEEKEAQAGAQVKKHVTDKVVTTQIKDADITGTVTKQVHLKSLMEKVVETSKGPVVDTQKAGSKKQKKEGLISTVAYPMTQERETVSKGAKRHTEQKEATSLVQRIKSLVEVGQTPRSEEVQAPAMEKALPITSQERDPQHGIESQDIQKTTVSLGAIPEEIATAMQWITEEEVECRLVEILSRQAKLRGIDLS